MFLNETITEKRTLEKFFSRFRQNITGHGHKFETPYGKKPLVYADWTASGRLYRPIEEKLQHTFGPYVGNTHSESNLTGSAMTCSYNEAKNIIKKHVNAGNDDAICCTSSGMTGAILKLQRIMGLKISSRLRNHVNINSELKPVVFVTHMEHHSNQTCWMETIADVEIISPDDNGNVDLEHFATLLKKYKEHPFKIASVISCSNVTGVFTPYHQMAEMIHKEGGLCFVDFAASAPYTDINMHSENKEQYLDAIFFSPHKFLGGPGSTGVLIFNKMLYDPASGPEQPGGGTITWTDPWGNYRFYDDVEIREDGGTPPFLQTIKAALAVKLKEEMKPEMMMKREKELLPQVFKRLRKIKGLHILADNIEERLCMFSFYIEGLHYNLGVRLLNDRFGIQVRGGCSCAGTYAHYLLGVSKNKSKKIFNQVVNDDLSMKPGWIRFSLHPTVTDEEVNYILDSINQTAENFESWSKDYEYDKHSNSFSHKSGMNYERSMVVDWF
jgi:selenocysteine lyase/cysteine desulfurase